VALTQHVPDYATVPNLAAPGFQLVGVVDEDPFAPRTWSGISAFLFAALRSRGVLHGAVAAQPPRMTSFAYKLLSIQPTLDRWRFRYHLNLNYYRRLTATARQRVAAFDAAAYQVILQIGAWYDLTRWSDKTVVSYHDGNLATLLASPYGYPSIAQRHIRRALEYERALYGRLDLIMPMSRWLADSFMRDNGVPARKVVPVGAGINLPRIAPTTDKDYTAPRILFVGHAFARKGGPGLLRAFARVRQEIPAAELTIIGPTLADPPPGVRALGFVSKSDAAGLARMLAEYQRATVFTMPSLYEPYGIVFAEAMAHRLPCVGTTICAMPEIIRDGDTGYVVPPADDRALADRLIGLLRDPLACRQMGERGYRKYEAEHTWDAVAARMCDAIASIIH
jgi:glycosyltransferase involved in cell wall biosynthesis